MGCPLKNLPEAILAILLYTGGKCTYPFCEAQRAGDYKTWKFLDKFLANGIARLGSCERFKYPLFSGLKTVKFEKDLGRFPCFATYVSASKSKDVAISFRGNDGTLLTFPEGFKGIYPSWRVDGMCCDVSWLSKFEEEMEVLFTRGHNLSFAVDIEETEWLLFPIRCLNHMLD